MGSPVAVFPGAVVDDKQLRVANNNIQTTLTVPMGSTDTTFTVTNATGIVAKSIATIDGEKIAVWDVSGQVVTVGYSSSGNTDGRAFDGTSAASHAAGATVALNVDAWHHNALKEEIKAIEAALGANLSQVATFPSSSALQVLRRKANVAGTVYEFATQPAVYSADFDFPAQTPGGSLVIGSNTITLSPMPLGITADSVGSHKLYISNGTGTAEAVPITDWTSTTVTVTCIHAHSGAWTIRSATAGIKEAIVFALAGGVGPASVRMPAGSLTIYAGIKQTTANMYLSLRGCGENITLIQAGAIEDDLFYFGDALGGLDLGDFAVYSTAYRASSTGVRVVGCPDGLVSNIRAAGQNVSFRFTSTARFFAFNLFASANTCFYWDSDSGLSPNVSTGIGYGWRSITAAGGVGIKFGPSTAGIILDAVYIEDGENPILITDDNAVGVLNEIQLSNLILDSFTGPGIKVWMRNASSACNRLSVRDGIIATIGAGLTAISYGVRVITAAASQVKSLTVSDLDIAFFSDSGALSSGGVQLGGTVDVRLDNVNCRSGDGYGTGLDFTAPGTSGTRAIGCQFGVDNLGQNHGSGVAERGVLIEGQAHSDIFIDDCSIGGSIAPTTNSSTDATTVEFGPNNRTMSIPTVASAAALPIPAFPTFYLSGTTGVTSVTGLDAAHAGRAGRIIPTDASPGAWTGSSTLKVSGTPAENKPGSWYWDGTVFYVTF